MSIKFANPPKKSLQALQAGLADIITPQDASFFSDIMTEPNPSLPLPNELFPHEVYLLRLADLGQGRGVDAAQLVAWRYFVGTTSMTRAAEVNQSLSGDHNFASVSEGPIYGTTPADFNKLNNIPDMTKRDFEPRLLRVPGLHVSALWLRDISGNQGDLFLPVRRVANFLKEPQYSKTDFESLLQRAARNKLAHTLGAEA